MSWVFSGWFFGWGKAITKAIWAILSVIVSCVVCACVGGTVGYLTGSILDIPKYGAPVSELMHYVFYWIAGSFISGLGIGVALAVRVITKKD